MSRRFGIGLDEIEPSATEHARQQAYVRDLFETAAAAGQARLIDPAEKLCDEDSCRVLMDGHSLYSDDDHLSEFGARWISGVFDPLFEPVEHSAEAAR